MPGVQEDTKTYYSGSSPREVRYAHYVCRPSQALAMRKTTGPIISHRFQYSPFERSLRTSTACSLVLSLVTCESG